MVDWIKPEYECSWWQYDHESDWEPVPGLEDKAKRKWNFYKNIATGEVVRSDQLPIGALYALDRDDAKDINCWPPAAPHDGLSIVCVTAGRTPDRTHHWYIENRASNCTMPNDNEHRCWVRHGTVGQRLHVDKNGKTCGAGAGSFFMGPDNCWHGFLQNGKLTQRQETWQGP